MKLIYCPKCQDVVRLQDVQRKCQCGLSWGRYTDELNAVYGGLAVPLGFDNHDFLLALDDQPVNDWHGGAKFDAFVIPEKCKTFKREGD